MEPAVFAPPLHVSPVKVAEHLIVLVRSGLVPPVLVVPEIDEIRERIPDLLGRAEGKGRPPCGK